MSAAREAVARALKADHRECNCEECCVDMADAALAALRPIIAAEIRAWAENEIDVYEPDAEVGGQLDRARTLGRIAQLWELVTDAPAIADRITTTTGEQQQ